MKVFLGGNKIVLLQALQQKQYHQRNLAVGDYWLLVCVEFVHFHKGVQVCANFHGSTSLKVEFTSTYRLFSANFFTSSVSPKLSHKYLCTEGSYWCKVAILLCKEILREKELR